MLIEYENSELIEPSIPKFLREYSGLVSNFYGLPKTHKTDVPLRPIVTFTRLLLFNLAQFMSSILEPLINNDFFFCFNAVHQLFKDLNFIKFPPTHYIMVAVDIASLFSFFFYI